MPTPALPPDLAARRRRARIAYTAAVAAGLLAIGLTMGLVIGTGESAHATLQTTSSPQALPGGTVRPSPSVVWRTDDRAAGGNPVAVGTVVTWSTHRLAGRDATTGAVRWSYTRTDVSICDAAQQGGRAYVLLRLHGNCNELSTFDADTGDRGWFRTLPDVGEGRLRFGAAGLVAAYPGSFHVIDTGTGYDRYATVPVTGTGCTFTGIVGGATGILVTERCGDGDHLALWSNVAQDGKGQQIWRIAVDAGVTAVAATDAVALAYQAATGTLTSWALADGAALGPITLDPPTSGPAGPAATPGGDVVLDLGAHAYDLSDSGVSQWSVASTGPPTVADALRTSVLVPTATGAVDIDGASGATLATYTLPHLGDGPDGAGPLVYSAGGGLVVVGDGVAYLR